MSDLQRLFNNLLIANYGSEKTIKIPFFGGFLELRMEFNNDMINLIEANAWIIGEKFENLAIKKGYSCPVGLARNVSIALERLKLEGLSVDAQLASSAYNHAEMIR